MEDFLGQPVEDGDAVIGQTITKVRTKAADGGDVQRLTVLFEDGSSLVIDGSFPACSTMTTPEDALCEIEGKRLEALSTKRSKPIDLKDGDWAIDVQLTLKVEGAEHTFEWRAIAHGGFDVSPEPRFQVHLPAYKMNP
jgi:hypothetical protein